MISSFIEKFVEDISADGNYSSAEKEQIKYVAKVFIYEFIKLVAIILVFSVVGYFKECIFVLGIMCITKPFSGGYHEDTQIRCFLATNVIILLIILLCESVSLNFVSCAILSMLSLFCIYHKVPVINDKMPLTKEKLIKRNRIIAITNNVIIIFLALVFYRSWFSELIIWTSSIQAMLLFNKYNK